MNFIIKGNNHRSKIIGFIVISLIIMIDVSISLKVWIDKEINLNQISFEQTAAFSAGMTYQEIAVIIGDGKMIKSTNPDAKVISYAWALADSKRSENQNTNYNEESYEYVVLDFKDNHFIGHRSLAPNFERRIINILLFQ